MKALHVFYGGTFDPPHLGHHELLKVLLQDPLTSFVHLVLTKQNPLKVSQPFGAIQDRLRWVEIWTQHLKSELSQDEFLKLKIEKSEILNPSTEASYTIDTLSALRDLEGGDWVIAGGADLLEDLAKWKRVETLLQSLHSFWIFPRVGLSMEKAISELPIALKRSCAFRWMGQELPGESSTEIRKLLLNPNASQNALRTHLLPSVLGDLVQMKA